MRERTRSAPPQAAGVSYVESMPLSDAEQVEVIATPSPPRLALQPLTPAASARPALRHQARAIQALGVEPRQQLAPAQAGYGERAAVQLLGNPSSLERQIQERGPDGAAQVRTALAPIEASEGKSAAQLPDLLNVNA